MSKKKFQKKHNDDFDDRIERGQRDRHRRHVAEKRLDRYLHTKNIDRLIELEESDYL